jgi:hypothetical protein
MKNHHAVVLSALALMTGVLSVPAMAQQATGPTSGSMTPPQQSAQQSAAYGAYGAGQVAGNPYATGYTPYGNYGTQQPQQNRQSVNPKPPSEVQPEDTAKAALSDKSHVPTAAEQGLKDPAADAASQWQLRRTLQESTSRQRGERESHPDVSTPVATSKANRGWLANWEKVLTEKGMSLEKVRFEENRLDADEFARWASNQLRYTIGPQPAL